MICTFAVSHSCASEVPITPHAAPHPPPRSYSICTPSNIRRTKLVKSDKHPAAKHPDVFSAWRRVNVGLVFIGRTHQTLEVRFLDATETPLLLVCLCHFHPPVFVYRTHSCRRGSCCAPPWFTANGGNAAAGSRAGFSPGSLTAAAASPVHSDAETHTHFHIKYHLPQSPH